MYSHKLLVSLCLAVVILGGIVWLVVSGPGGSEPGDAGGPGAGTVASSDAATEDAADGPDKAKSSADADAVASEDKAGDAAPPPVVDDRPVAIEGKVTDAKGAGVPDAVVVVLDRFVWEKEVGTVRPEMNRNPFEGLRNVHESLAAAAARMPRFATDDEGVYRVRGLDDGDYRVFVSHGDFLPHREDHWVAVVAETTARYDVELVAGHAITGQVFDPGGDPLPMAAVTVRPTEIAGLRGIGKMVQTAIEATGGDSLAGRDAVVTGEDGKFRVSSLEPRVYDIRVELDGYAWGEVRKVPAGTNDVRLVLKPAARVYGRVLSPKREPLPRVEVVLAQPELDFRRMRNPMAMAMADFDILGEKTRRTTTEEDGSFHLDAFRDGSYEFVVRADDYPTYQQRVKFAGETIDAGDIVLESAYPITGRVLDEGGRSVAGAKVRAVGAEIREGGARGGPGGAPPANKGRTDEDVTDDDGRFRLARLEAGAYSLSIDAAGFVRLTTNVEADDGPVTLTLRVGTTIAGRVVDSETQEPVAGARVKKSWEARNAFESDDDGRFELSGVDLGNAPDARVQLIVEHDEYAREFCNLQRSELEDLVIRLKARKGIEGVVRDDRGETVRGARVSIEIPGFPTAIMNLSPQGSPGESFTNEAGEFFLVAPQMGGDANFEVVAKYPGFATARFGPLKARESIPFVEIQLSKGSSIEGFVTDLDGKPIAGAQVRARRNVELSGEALIFATMLPMPIGEVAYSREDGKYRLRGIEPGTYRIDARAIGYAKKAISPVEVGEGPAPLDITLDPGGVITGRVVDLDGEPLTGVEVVAFLRFEGSDPTGPGADIERRMIQLGGVGNASTKTGDDGRFELTQLPEGSFRVVARAPRHEPATTDDAQAGDDVSDLVLAPFCSLRGIVIDAATGAPVPRFQVRLGERLEEGTGDFRERWEFRRRVDDAQGVFAYAEVPQREYRGSVRADAYMMARQIVRLEPGEERELRIELTPGWRITGAVTDANSGAPIQGAKLWIHRRQQAGDETRQSWWERRRDRTSDEAGEFSFGGLDEGKYSVSAQHPDWYFDGNPRTLEFEAPFDRPVVINIPMRPAGRLRGQISNLRAFDSRRSGYRLGLKRYSNEDRGDEAEPKFNWSTSTMLRPDGSYEATGLRPGRYRVQLAFQVWRPAEDKGGADTPPAGPDTIGDVEIRVGETQRFDAAAP